MNFDEQLDAIEALADHGDVSGAMARAQGLRSGLQPGASARLHLLLASLTARGGDLAGALPLLDVAEALANAAGLHGVRLEARVTRASVLAASGEYDQAIPMLAGAIRELEGHPELGELRADAQAELRSYRNLVSPKTLATWASLLG